MFPNFIPNYFSEPDTAPTNVRLSAYQPDKGLSVEWDRLACGDTRAHIQHYIVNICPSSQGSNCSGAHTTYTTENTASHYTIEGLTRDTRYKVWIVALAEGGISPSSDHLFGVVVDRSKFMGLSILVNNKIRAWLFKTDNVVS